MGSDYHLISHWRVRAELDDVAAVLAEPRGLVRWWPEVYLDVAVEEEGDDAGAGKVVRVHSRGRLPYTLRWTFRVVEARWPHGATIEAWGDLTGRGTWALAQQGAEVAVTYDWQVRAEKPLLRLLSPLLKPLFAWNHRWAMAKGEVGLRRELERRHRARAEAAPADPGRAR
jgi:hypothetical protein